MFVQFYYEDGKPLLGSDGGVFVNDLKTVKGLLKRLRGWHRPFKRGVETFKIFRVVGSKYGDDSKWPVLYEGDVEEFWGAR